LLFKQVGFGSLVHYKSVEELETLLTEMKEQFPEVTSNLTIGKSVFGKEINGVLLMEKPTKTTPKKALEIARQRPSLFVNGAHHARELTSISMNVYLMLKFIHSWTHK
jgi:hypothetical protein